MVFFISSSVSKKKGRGGERGEREGRGRGEGGEREGRGRGEGGEREGRGRGEGGEREGIHTNCLQLN